MRRLALPFTAVLGFAVAVVPALADDQSVGTGSTSYTPDQVAVKPGEKVTVSNTSGGFHDLHWVDTDENEEAAPNTTSWSHDRTFTTAGEYTFFCSFHGSETSGMRGKVFVNAAGTVPTTGGGGTTTTTTTTPPPTTTTGTSTTPPPPGGTTTTGTSTTPPPPPGGSADTTPPRVTSARGSATRRVVTVRLTLSEAATITVRVLRRGRRVARRTFERDGGAVVLRVRRAFRAGRYSVRLALVDDAGNRTTRSLTVRVK